MLIFNFTSFFFFAEKNGSGALTVPACEVKPLMWYMYIINKQLGNSSHLWKLKADYDVMEILTNEAWNQPRGFPTTESSFILIRVSSWLLDSHCVNQDTSLHNSSPDQIWFCFHAQREIMGCPPFLNSRSRIIWTNWFSAFKIL